MSIDEVLIKSGDVLGSPLRDAGDHKLGAIREIFLDRRTGQARFAIIELGALFPASGKFHPIPWRALTYDGNSDGYVTTLTKDFLKNSPAYDRDQLADMSYAWGEQTERYFASLSDEGRARGLSARGDG